MSKSRQSKCAVERELIDLLRNHGYEVKRVRPKPFGSPVVFCRRKRQPWFIAMLFEDWATLHLQRTKPAPFSERASMGDMSLDAIFYHVWSGEAMTLQELNQHYALLEQLQEAREQMEYFRSKATSITSRLTGMPKAQGVSDKVGGFAAEIADMADTIAQLESQVRSSEERVSAFIKAIPDSNIRLIMRLRFIHGLSWVEVADAAGRWATEASVKSSCYRYLKVLGKGTPIDCGRSDPDLCSVSDAD